MNRVLVVYDVDAFYADRFADVINRKETIPWTVRAFTSFEKLKKYAETENIELLLISGDIDVEDVEKIGAEQVMVLTKGSENKLVEKYPGVYKFQSSDNIMRELMTYYNENITTSKLCMTLKAQILGIYSPVNRCFKTTLSIAIGKLLSEKNKVLYISLEVYSGFEKLMGRQHISDLSDVIYYYLQGMCSSTKISTAVYSYGGLDYIPPVRYGEDLSELGNEQIRDMILKIAEKQIYDFIIVDFGQKQREAIDIIDICSSIYMPVRDDAISSAKLEDFFEYLKLSGKEMLADRINKIKLPKPSWRSETDCFFEGILWGDFGNSVREVVRGIET